MLHLYSESIATNDIGQKGLLPKALCPMSALALVESSIETLPRKCCAVNEVGFDTIAWIKTVQPCKSTQPGQMNLACGWARLFLIHLDSLSIPRP